ncbi:hypothetical protein R6Q59_008408 [Mikania micrantha]
MASRWCVGILVTLIAIAIVGLSDGKELRPSDHGLTNGTDAPQTAQAQSPEMSSFFGDVESSGTQPLPETDGRNYSDPSWNSRRVGGAEHVMKVLSVLSLVCGVAGIVLLVAAGVLFWKQRSGGVLSS